MRGLRPWEQFLTYCRKIARTEGTDLWAAQLSDDRFLPEIEKHLAERGGDTARPPLEGYTTEVRALYMVANQIRLLIRVMGGGEIDFIEGPEGPAERLKARKRQRAMKRIDQLLGR